MRTGARLSLIRSSILGGLAFGALFGIPYSLLPAITGRRAVDSMSVLVMFLFTAVFFGLALFLFTAWQARRFNKERQEISQRSLVILDTGANHFVGRESVGGWLFLTEQSLCFKSHKRNIQVHELDIPLEDVKRVSPANSMGIVPNRLLIELSDGRTERFVVSLRGQWIKALDGLRSTSAEEGEIQSSTQ